jgi:hypothetical protein
MKYKIRDYITYTLLIGKPKGKRTFLGHALRQSIIIMGHVVRK